MVTDIQEAEEILYVDNDHKSLPWDVPVHIGILWSCGLLLLKVSKGMKSYFCLDSRIQSPDFLKGVLCYSCPIAS